VTRQQAGQLVALLRTAYPTKSVSADTLKLYESRLARQGAGSLHFEIAREAILELIDVEKFWPSVAEIKQAYRDVSARHRGQEKPEELPEPSPEEKQRMLAQMREYMVAIGRSMEPA
jgi:hypothetical protein